MAENRFDLRQHIEQLHVARPEIQREALEEFSLAIGRRFVVPRSVPNWLGRTDAPNRPRAFQQ
jgi:hypothetical protein